MTFFLGFVCVGFWRQFVDRKLFSHLSGEFEQCEMFKYHENFYTIHQFSHFVIIYKPFFLIIKPLRFSQKREKNSEILFIIIFISFQKILTDFFFRSRQICWFLFAFFFAGSRCRQIWKNFHQAPWAGNC